MPRTGIEPIPSDYKTNILPIELTGFFLLQYIILISSTFFFQYNFYLFFCNYNLLLINLNII